LTVLHTHRGLAGCPWPCRGKTVRHGNGFRLEAKPYGTVTASGCFHSSEQQPLHLRTAPQPKRTRLPLIHSTADAVARVAFRPSSAHAYAPRHSTCPLTVRDHIYMVMRNIYMHALLLPEATNNARASRCTMRPCLTIEAVVDRRLHRHMPHMHAAASSWISTSRSQVSAEVTPQPSLSTHWQESCIVHAARLRILRPSRHHTPHHVRSLCQDRGLPQLGITASEPTASYVGQLCRPVMSASYVGPLCRTVTSASNVGP